MAFSPGLMDAQIWTLDGREIDGTMRPDLADHGRLNESREGLPIVVDSQWAQGYICTRMHAA